MTENIQEIIAQNIRFYRKKAKMTQAQLAKRINKTVEMVCQVENNMSSTKLSTLQSIAEVFGLEVYQLCLPKNNIDLSRYDDELKKTITELQEQPDIFSEDLINLLQYFKFKK